MIKNYRINAPSEFHTWLDSILLATTTGDSPPPPPPPPPPDEEAVKISQSFGALNMRILPAEGQQILELRHVFTTFSGSWEVEENTPYKSGVEQWARDAWLKPWGAPDYVDSFGGDRHLFGAVMDKTGKLQPNVMIRFRWPDGVKYKMTSAKHGWANTPFFDIYDPDKGNSGVWKWGPDGADQVLGGGLPNGQHVSYFAVWQYV